MVTATSAAKKSTGFNFRLLLEVILFLFSIMAILMFTGIQIEDKILHNTCNAITICNICTCCKHDVSTLVENKINIQKKNLR